MMLNVCIITSICFAGICSLATICRNISDVIKCEQFIIQCHAHAVVTLLTSYTPLHQVTSSMVHILTQAGAFK